MTDPARRGLFVAEGTSDLPIADLVESLFAAGGMVVDLSRPDFSRLTVSKDVSSRVDAGIRLMAVQPDVVVVHRDADNAGADTRRQEIRRAITRLDYSGAVVPVVPVRMTEAWLLLDQDAIRFVAGNPRGRAQLDLPKRPAAESVADPKQVLRAALLDAASVTGRRRTRLDSRFPQNRRQLLQRLDTEGPVTHLVSWQTMVSDIDTVVTRWAG